MQSKYSSLISNLLSISERQVSHTIDLLSNGATIPFISRYRKEATGGLDEVAVGDIKKSYDKLCELSRRKETVINSIEEQGKLTPELRSRIDDCWDSTVLEDIYLPYKPKRQTRAEVARKRGLEPLADILWSQNERDVLSRAAEFITDDVKDAEMALQGARDIVAERVSEDEFSRNAVRAIFRRGAVVSCCVVKGKEEEGVKYRDYFEFSEPLSKCSSHRLLAIRRAENEGILKVAISADDDQCYDALCRKFVRGNNQAAQQVEMAVKDGFKRLIKPSIETEFANLSKEKADQQAIKVFVDNLRQLLLSAPLGQRRVMGVDPGFRTGCKIVCLDAQGSLLHNDTIYPHEPQKDTAAAAEIITGLVKKYAIEAIAIGNGTASRETNDFLNGLNYESAPQIFVVSEDGASIYSASTIARDEFPNHDITVRGAVSIGRRLMDPLSELVKIDPKSIGVGQYQHDVDQTKLKESLDQTVENCVNLVGVNLNTAGKHLLTYISGLGPALAQNIVDFRTANGPFKSRSELLKVPRLGNKAFEQCAGFLRITAAQNPLDSSAVHPESYHVVQKMAADAQCTVRELIDNKEIKKSLHLEKYISPQIGMPTLLDIFAELEKPGLDPRQAIETFEFDPTVKTITDLREGMTLPGIISNITNFGCFVDIGIKEKGLVHVSEMADKFVREPTDVVTLHQRVNVRVISIDNQRKRIALSLKIQK